MVQISPLLCRPPLHSFRWLPEVRWGAPFNTLLIIINIKENSVRCLPMVLQRVVLLGTALPSCKRLITTNFSSFILFYFFHTAFFCSARRATSFFAFILLDFILHVSKAKILPFLPLCYRTWRSAFFIFITIVTANVFLFFFLFWKEKVLETWSIRVDGMIMTSNWITVIYCFFFSLVLSDSKKGENGMYLRKKLSGK